MEGYPRRPRFFALRFMRLLAKMCAAQEIGPEAFTLLAVVVNTEDARGYRSPVTFFNEQLFPMCGFANVKALDRARKRAVETGWLSYKAGGKGVPGRYFVTIPTGYESVDDAPSDEGYRQLSLVENDQANAREVGKEAGEKREESGERSGREAPDKRQESGQHSSLRENPLPLSQERGAREPQPSANGIKLHEAAFMAMRFRDRFEAIVKRHPVKDPPMQAESNWKLAAVDEETAEKIDNAHANFCASQRWKDGIGIPSLKKFLAEGYWENPPQPEKPRDNAKRAERTSARYDPAIHG